MVQSPQADEQGCASISWLSLENAHPNSAERLNAALPAVPLTSLTTCVQFKCF